MVAESVNCFGYISVSIQAYFSIHRNTLYYIQLYRLNYVLGIPKVKGKFCVIDRRAATLIICIRRVVYNK